MGYIKSIEGLTAKDRNIAGGKASALGEMMRAGVVVPAGFVLLCKAFEDFLSHNRFGDQITDILKSIRANDARTVENASDKIIKYILGGQIPDKIYAEINKAFTTQRLKKVAVRSSATSEDGASFAWAGQLDTYLNTEKSGLMENIKKCWASLYTPRAIFYRLENNLMNKKISVAVIVQKMVASDFAGVIFTANPATGNREQIIVEAGPGLGEKVVSGNITPGRFIIDKGTGLIFDKHLVFHTITDSQAIRLAKTSASLEKYFKYPCDIEWAIVNNSIYFLQCRPITTLPKISAASPDIAEYVISRKWFIGIRAEASLLFYSAKQDGTDKYVKKWHGLPFAETILVPIRNNYPIRVFNSDQAKLFHALSLAKIVKQPALLETCIKKSDAVWRVIKDQNSALKKYVAANDYRHGLNEFFHLLESYKKASSWFNIIFSLGLKLTENKASVPGAAKILRKHDFWRNSIALKEEKIGETIYYFIRHVLNKRKIAADPLAVVNYLTADELGNWLNGKISDKKMTDMVSLRTDSGYVYMHLRNYGQRIITDKADILKISGYFNALSQAKVVKAGKILTGQPALQSDAIIRGKAIVIKDKSELPSKGKWARHKIIVAIQTTPHYIPYAKKAKGIITDEGGITCHAAIIAREENKPCIIGARNATSLISDNDVVEMNMQSGVVKIIRKK